jgi:hypothetical protein
MKIKLTAAQRKAGVDLRDVVGSVGGRAATKKARKPRVAQYPEEDPCHGAQVVAASYLVGAGIGTLIDLGLSDRQIFVIAKQIAANIHSAVKESKL